MEALIHSVLPSIWQDDEGQDDGGWEGLETMGEVGPVFGKMIGGKIMA